MPVVLFTNVSAYRAVELMHATQGHMRYKLWKEPESEEGHTFRIMCDKDVPLSDPWDAKHLAMPGAQGSGPKLVPLNAGPVRIRGVPPRIGGAARRPEVSRARYTIRAPSYRGTDSCVHHRG